MSGNEKSKDRQEDTAGDLNLPRGGAAANAPAKDLVDCTDQGPRRRDEDPGLDKFGMPDSRYTDPGSSLAPTPAEQALRGTKES